MSDSRPPSDLHADAQESAWIRTQLDTDIQFPPLPRTVAEVTSLVTEDDKAPDPRKLADLVDSDPVVAATVLQRINSAYYGMRRRITGVRKAVMLLGFLDVANVVLTAGMLKLKKVFSEEDQLALFNRIMATSVGVGQFAREGANALELSVEGPAYSAGLLHSIGRLIFLYSAPDDYAALWQADDETALPSIDAEAFIFGISHPEIGAHASDGWELPDVIVHAIRHHAAPHHVTEPAYRDVTALVAVAVTAQHMMPPTSENVDLSKTASVQHLAKTIDAAPSTIEEAFEERRSRVQNYVSMIMSS